MPERERETGARLARGASAHRVHDNHHRALGSGDGGVNIYGGPELSNAEIDQFLAHRRNEKFGIRHGLIVPAHAICARTHLTSVTRHENTKQNQTISFSYFRAFAAIR